MTRKIKFRGKDEQGEWQEGHLLVQLGTHYILTPIWEMYRNEYVETDRSTKHRVSACTVSQFTGILDKNGKEIYEGDIVEYTTCYFGNEKRHRKVVEWESFDSDDFGEPHNIGYFNLSEYMEVIGNIYDNPELLYK